MKRLIIQCATILLAFLAGMVFMTYTTYMGNRDMTGEMSGATLPVVYAEKDGELYNEMHGYVEAMDGASMRDSVLGLSEDHSLGLAIEKFNAQVQTISYELRTPDMSRLIEGGETLPAEDDGKYLHLQLEFKDLMDRGEWYLLILKLQTDGQEEICYYAQISYLGENHVQECVDFAKQFHEMTVTKDTDSWLLSKLEPNSTMDGKSLGYVNIHSRSGPVTWGDMQIRQETEPSIRFTGLSADTAALVMEYQVRDTDTEELYQVSEAFCVRYTASTMYLQTYERTAEHIFTVDGQLVEDGKISFGIQSGEINYKKNTEENVIGFVQQGQLWCYDFGQNRLSLVYGFEDGTDSRGLYGAHDFRILSVEDSGSMDFLVYGYMNRGRYEGRSGVLLCRYDALMNTVEERFFLPSDHPYQILKDEVGKLSIVNADGMAWLSWQGRILKIDLADVSSELLAGDILEEDIQVSEDGHFAAWTDAEAACISLLNTETGQIHQIDAEDGEILQVLGFMEDDFIYGTARTEDIRTDAAGGQTAPMYRVVIRDPEGSEVREFNYEDRGKYVTGVTIAENRIDLKCVSRSADGGYEEALPEPITYTSEPVDEKLRLTVASDEVRRNEYSFAYTGTMKDGAMKQPKVKLVLFENDRTLTPEGDGTAYYSAWLFNGTAESFPTLTEAVESAYDGMGTVWKGSLCFFERFGYASRTQLDGFGEPETLAASGSSTAQCLQLLLRDKQVYTDVQGCMDAGMAVWEILEEELGEESCILSGVSVSAVKYYVAAGSPVVALLADGGAVLIVGYDQQNMIYYEPGQTSLTRLGNADSAAMFEQAGNLYFTCLP